MGLTAFYASVQKFNFVFGEYDIGYVFGTSVKSVHVVLCVGVIWFFDLYE